MFGFDLKTSIIIGAALALSSTAIVLTVLSKNGDIHLPYGRNSVGILLLQDLAVIPILLMISMFSDSSIALPELLWKTFYSAVIVGIVLYLLSRYVLEHFLAYVVRTNVEELFIATIPVIILASSLFAHSFGFTYSLGAFLAGMLIAETNYKYQIEADLIPFRDILPGIFFVTVGLQVDFMAVVENFWTIAFPLVGAVIY